MTIFKRPPAPNSVANVTGISGRPPLLLTRLQKKYSALPLCGSQNLPPSLPLSITSRSQVTLNLRYASYRYLSQPQVGHKCQSKAMGRCDIPFQSYIGFDKCIFDVVCLLDAQKKLAIDPTILESKVDQLRIFGRNQVKFGVFS